MASTPLRYPRLPGTTSALDTPFETKTTALLYLRALTSGIDFHLASDVRGAGAFADVVLKVLRHDARVTTIFLRLKHTERHLIYRQMLTAPKAHLPIQKFFKSYLEIKESMSSAQSGLLFDGRIEDCVFVAYTNGRGDADLGEGQSVAGSLESILWSGRGGVHVFDPVRDGDLWECLREGGGDARRFLKQFRLFCGQPGVGELEGLVRDELRKMEDDEYRGIDVDRLCDCFLDNVRVWWGTDNVVLDKNSDILERARQTMLCSKIARKGATC